MRVNHGILDVMLIILHVAFFASRSRVDLQVSQRRFAERVSAARLQRVRPNCLSSIEHYFGASDSSGFNKANHLL